MGDPQVLYFSTNGLLKHSFGARKRDVKKFLHGKPCALCNFFVKGLEVVDKLWLNTSFSLAQPKGEGVTLSRFIMGTLIVSATPQVAIQNTLRVGTVVRFSASHVAQCENKFERDEGWREEG